jgi:predicted transcriptional regulator
MSVSEKSELLGMTTEIVASYIANNTIAQDELPNLIHSVFAALSEAVSDPVAEDPVELTPAIPIDESVQDDVIICLEDGLPFKSLKRHLRSKYNLTPEAYREKWGLPDDYPMVSKNYAKARSELAKKSGLGRNRPKY